MFDDDKREHCFFAKLNMNGKCIANCSKNVLVDGKMTDCIGRPSENIDDYINRVESERKLT